MTDALWIVQPITYAGLGVLVGLLPFLAGLIYAGAWKRVLPWLCASHLAFACFITGTNLTQAHQISYVIDPFPHLIGILAKTLLPATLAFGLGMGLSRWRKGKGLQSHRANRQP